MTSAGARAKDDLRVRIESIEALIVMATSMYCACTLCVLVVDCFWLCRSYFTCSTY